MRTGARPLDGETVIPGLIEAHAVDVALNHITSLQDPSRLTVMKGGVLV
jgi:hypothetical protein